MVVAVNFDNILATSSKTSSITLPAFKQHGLRISFQANKDVKDCETVYSISKPILPFAASDVFHAKIKYLKRLSQDDTSDRPVYEATFDIKGSNYSIKPGDTIGIIPQNDEKDVDIVIKRLCLVSKIDLVYCLTVDCSQKAAKIPLHVPQKSTLRYVITNCVDLRFIVKKLFLLALSKFTEDETERKTLELLCSKEGSEMYTQHILNKNICFIDILNMFKTCKPPVELILANLPKLLPRPYSIANSSLRGDDIIKICFSVKTLHNKRKGLTTGWLESIFESDSCLENRMENLSVICNSKKEFSVPIYLRKSMGFAMPKNLTTPLLLIATGTGLAPFMGFFEDRFCIKGNQTDTILGKTWLFYGCRDPKEDFLYEDELNLYLAKGILMKLSTSYSRIDNKGIKYVQDAVKENGKDIVQFVQNGAAVFVCGDLKTMVTQVKTAIIECFVTHANKTKDEAEKIVTEMEHHKKYMIDVWS